MKKIVLLLATLIIAVVFSPAIHSIGISEIMYNPEGSDDNREFIEIYGTNNLSEFIIGDLAENDSLELVSWKDSNYNLIVEAGFDYSGLNCSIYSAGSSIGNNLNNQFDTVFLYKNSSIIDSTNYTNIFGNGNGYSIELFRNDWNESLVLGGTPCSANSRIFIQDSPQGLNQSTNQSLNQTSNSSLNEPSQPAINNTGNISQNSTPQNNCDVSIGLQVQKTFFENKEKIEFYNTLSSKAYDFEIEYWIEDSSGEIIKNKVKTTNTNKKSYTPSIKQKEQALIIKNRISFLDCENSNINRSSEKVVVVRNPEFVEECDCEETVCKEPDKESAYISSSSDTEGSSIRSFYTRNKIIGEEINLYAGVQGQGFYTLNIYSLNLLNSTEVDIDGSKTEKFSVKTIPGKNIFFAELESSNKTIGFGKLEVDREEEAEEKNKESVQKSHPDNEQELSQKNSPALTISAETGQNAITGSAVSIYESDDSKVKKYLNYGLVFVFVIGIGIFFKGKFDGRKKQKNKRKAKDRAGMGKSKDNV